MKVWIKFNSLKIENLSFGKLVAAANSYEIVCEGGILFRDLNKIKIQLVTRGKNLWMVILL